MVQTRLHLLGHEEAVHTEIGKKNQEKSLIKECIGVSKSWFGRSRVKLLANS